ncbi:MAG: DUF2232 domain-containing protein [Christensenella sp.]|nr:DUF2232 domain-containing protein [Christensenella sp.]
MENSNQQPSRAKQRGWLVLLLSTVVAFIAAFFPFALLIAPALWAYAGARTKPYWMLLPIATFALSTLMLDSAATLAGLYGAAAFAAVILYVLMTRRFSNSDTALLLSGVFLLGLYASVCLPGVLAGRGAFADIQSEMSSLITFYKESLAQMPQLDATMSKSALDTMNLMYESVPTSFVGVLCVFASILGLSNLLFFRLFCRKHPEITISPMRAFREWTLPRSMTLGLFLMLIGSLIAELAGWTFADSFAVTANILVAIPLFLMGLCVTDFFIARTKKNVTITRVLVYAGFAFFYYYLYYPLLLLGCFDQIFRLRLRLSGMPPNEAV